MSRILTATLISFALRFGIRAQTLATAANTPISFTDIKSPAPIWSGEGRVPAGSGNQKVFLTPDRHSVIILWPNPDGTVTKRKFDLRRAAKRFMFTMLF